MLSAAIGIGRRRSLSCLRPLSSPSPSPSPSTMSKRCFRTSVKRRQQEQASAGTSGTSGNTTRSVISRRIWKNHEKTISKKKNGSGGTSDGKKDEKPWPASVIRIAYVTGAIVIPYTTIWLITSNPTLRYIFQDYIPLDKFRKHFGKVELNAQPYGEAVGGEGGENNHNNEVDVGYYQFPEEMDYDQRKKQAVIDELENSNVSVNVYWWSGTGSSSTSSASSIPTIQQEETKHNIPASTRANRMALSKVLRNTASTSNDDSDGMATRNIGIDFEDTIKSSMEKGEGDEMTTMMMDSTSFGSGDGVVVEGTTSSAIKPLIRQSQTFSTWHHHASPLQQQQQDEQNNKNSNNKNNNGTTKNYSSITDEELEEERLIYEIQQLKNSLTDSTNIRSTDDIMEELTRSERQLRQLRWNRRLRYFQLS